MFEHHILDSEFTEIVKQIFEKHGASALQQIRKLYLVQREIRRFDEALKQAEENIKKGEEFLKSRLAKEVPGFDNDKLAQLEETYQKEAMAAIEPSLRFLEKVRRETVELTLNSIKQSKNQIAEYEKELKAKLKEEERIIRNLDRNIKASLHKIKKADKYA